MCNKLATLLIESLSTPESTSIECNAMCIGNERCTRNVNRRRYRAEAEAADDESYHVGQQTAS